MKKVIAFAVAVLLMFALSVSSAYAANLIVLKTDIDNVKTNNKYFIVSGNGQPNTTVELILNDNLNDKWVIDESAVFARLVILNPGENTLLLKAYKGDQVQIIKGKVILTKKDGIWQITITAIEELIKSLLK
ncbi:hypothetical protein O163_13395 [Caldanaerobacter subterraneus subsp. yonseiensis KB-1]|uniref:Uncharacterized protein n=1 Tax=Caldanaerobacter subterraneus subsp. yonseiensis KB-1 TaxID=1388761 RepID=U5CDA8_CALSX|nr:hypothetical protein [Caldanaerobacter subterraneus]ERM90895.1 hypothetical protein O163_13395 [Caldanaerobacter subterraneus subsp. yonseiensis KB-1]